MQIIHVSPFAGAWEDAQATQIQYDGEWAINYDDKVDAVSVNCAGAQARKESGLPSDIKIDVIGTSDYGGRFKYHGYFIDS